MRPRTRAAVNPTLRRQLERFMHGGRRHPQLAGDGTEAKPFRLELLDLSGTPVDGGRATKLNATGLGSRQPGIHALFDDAALELGHCHEYAKLEPSSRIIVAGVNALTAGDQWHPQPVRAPNC
jgi:hypothetical protein